MKVNKINISNTEFKAQNHKEKENNNITSAKKIKISKKDMLYGIGVLGALGVASYGIIKHKSSKKELKNALDKINQITKDSEEKLESVKKEITEKTQQEIEKLNESLITEKNMRKALLEELTEEKKFVNSEALEKALTLEKPSSEGLSLTERWSEQGRTNFAKREEIKIQDIEAKANELKALEEQRFSILREAQSLKEKRVELQNMAGKIEEQKNIVRNMETGIENRTKELKSIKEKLDAEKIQLLKDKTIIETKENALVIKNKNYLDNLRREVTNRRRAEDVMQKKREKLAETERRVTALSQELDAKMSEFKAKAEDLAERENALETAKKELEAEKNKLAEQKTKLIKSEQELKRKQAEINQKTAEAEKKIKTAENLKKESDVKSKENSKILRFVQTLDKPSDEELSLMELWSKRAKMDFITSKETEIPNIETAIEKIKAEYKPATTTKTTDEAKEIKAIYNEAYKNKTTENITAQTKSQADAEIARYNQAVKNSALAEQTELLEQQAKSDITRNEQIIRESIAKHEKVVTEDAKEVVPEKITAKNEVPSENIKSKIGFNDENVAWFEKIKTQSSGNGLNSLPESFNEEMRKFGMDDRFSKPVFLTIAGKLNYVSEKSAEKISHSAYKNPVMYIYETIKRKARRKKIRQRFNKITANRKSHGLHDLSMFRLITKSDKPLRVLNEEKYNTILNMSDAEISQKIMPRSEFMANKNKYILEEFEILEKQIEEKRNHIRTKDLFRGLKEDIYERYSSKSKNK